MRFSLLTSSRLLVPKPPFAVPGLRSPQVGGGPHWASHWMPSPLLPSYSTHSHSLQGQKCLHSSCQGPVASACSPSLVLCSLRKRKIWFCKCTLSLVCKPSAAFVYVCGQCRLGCPWLPVREQNERKTHRLTLGDMTLSSVLPTIWDRIEDREG